MDLPQHRLPQYSGADALAKSNVTGDADDDDEEDEEELDGDDDGNDDDDDDDDDDEEDEEEHHHEPPASRNQGVSDREILGEDSDEDDPEQDKSTTPRCIQILDLNSRNPMISFDGQVYSCSWGKTIGTDLIFAAKGALGDSTRPVMRGDGFDLLTTSRIKLVGTPVILEPVNKGQTEVGNEATGQAPAATTANGVLQPEPTPAQPHPEPPQPDPFAALEANDAMPLRPMTDPASEAHMQERNAWLQRFAEIRRGRGEPVTIPVRSGKQMINFVPRFQEHNLAVGDAIQSRDGGSSGSGYTDNQDQSTVDVTRDVGTPPPSGALAPSTPRGPGQARAQVRGRGRGRGGRPRGRGRGRGTNDVVDILVGFNQGNNG